MKKTFILTALFFSLFLIGCKDEDPTTNPNGQFKWKVTMYTYNRAFDALHQQGKEIIDGKYPSKYVYGKVTYYENKTSAEIDSIIAPLQDTKNSPNGWSDKDYFGAVVYEYQHYTKEFVKK